MRATRLGKGAACCALLLACAGSRSRPTPASRPSVPPSALRDTQTSPREALLQGSIRDVAGHPIPDARVTAIELPRALDSKMWTSWSDRDGTFAIHVPPGRYSVTVTADALEATFAGSFEVDGRAGSPLKIAMVEGRRQIRGSVRLQGGLPASFAEVTLRPIGADRANVFLLRTDAAGAFSIFVPAARTYKVRAELAPYAGVETMIELDAPDSDVMLTLGKERVSVPPSGRARAWLKQHASPIVVPDGDPSSASASKDVSDLALLGDMVRDARIVALGDNPHNASELFRLRHRLTRYLIEHRGFDTIAMEVNWPEADEIDAYLQSGKGDLPALLAGLHFWTTDTTEMLETLRWLRRHNESAEHKVHVRGIDMQHTALSARALSQFFEEPPRRLGLTLRAQVLALLERFARGSAAAAYEGLSAQEIEDARATLEVLGDVLRRSSMRPLPARASRSAALLRHARLLVQADDDFHDPSSRDQAMLDNFDALLASSDRARVVLWAHSWHVSFEQVPERTVGMSLREKYGQDYIAVGTHFLRGSFRAWDWTLGKRFDRGVREFELGRAAPDSLEGVLSEFGEHAFLVDLRGARDTDPSPVAAWLRQPVKTRSIGSAFESDRASYEYISPALAYDALIQVDHVHAAHPTATGVRLPEE
jgi:erythromycin esterase